MLTDKQLAANRRNAQKSTGPRTPGGKAIVRLNAVKHALTGQLTLVPPCQHEAFRDLSTRLTASLRPSGEQELQVAARIVRDTWRLARAAANEDNIYALDLMENTNDRILTETGDPHPDPEFTVAVVNARTSLQRGRDFERNSLYEQRLKRGLLNDYKLFRELQKDRNRQESSYYARPRANSGDAVKQAATAPFSPSNGFDFADFPLAAYGSPIDPKIDAQTVTSTHLYVPLSQKGPQHLVLQPFWPC